MRKLEKSPARRQKTNRPGDILQTLDRQDLHLIGNRRKGEEEDQYPHDTANRETERQHVDRRRDAVHDAEDQVDDEDRNQDRGRQLGSDKEDRPRHLDEVNHRAVEIDPGRRHLIDGQVGIALAEGLKEHDVPPERQEHHDRQLKGKGPKNRHLAPGLG